MDCYRPYLDEFSRAGGFCPVSYTDVKARADRSSSFSVDYAWLEEVSLLIDQYLRTMYV